LSLGKKKQEKGPTYMLSFVVLLGIHYFFEGNAGTSTSQVHSSLHCKSEDGCSKFKGKFLKL
jgi:hypothetical protein